MWNSLLAGNESKGKMSGIVRNVWVHEEAVDCLRKPLERLLEEVDDLKAKKKTLLKLRRACLLKNNPYDL